MSREPYCHVKKPSDDEELICKACGKPGHFERLSSTAAKRDERVPIFGGADVFTRRVQLEVYHPRCSACREEALHELQTDPLYAPSLDKLGRALRRRIVKNVASNPDRPVVIGFAADDVIALWIKQAGRCALTGVPLTCETGAATDARVDRKNASGNFTLDNIQLVTATITAMKANAKTRKTVAKMQHEADRRRHEDDLLAAIEAL